MLTAAIVCACSIAVASPVPGPIAPPTTTEAAEAARRWANALWAEASAAAKAATEETKRAAAALRDTAIGTAVGPDDPETLVMTRADDGEILWLPLDEAWGGADASTAPAPQRVVVLIHGLDEYGVIWNELAPHLADAGLAAVRFDYANDQAIHATSEQFADSLRALRARGVQRVDIVAHSMGGLISRDVLTRRAWYAGDAAAPADAALPVVERLIFVGTPHTGSPLAFLQPLSEAREQILRRATGTSRPGAGLFVSRVDGAGEAARDLAPDSDFLRDLTSRTTGAGGGLPSNVRITNIVGAISPPASGWVEWFGGEDARALLGDEAAQSVRSWAGATAGSIGDGLVPVDRARLAGAADEVVVRADHRSMINRWMPGGKGTPPAPAIPVIIDRLSK